MMNVTTDEAEVFFKTAKELVAPKISLVDEFNIFLLKAKALMVDSEDIKTEFERFVERARELLEVDSDVIEKFLEFIDKGRALVIIDAKEKLDFLNKRIAKSEGSQREINLLEIFGIMRKELPHSAFLAWLLDPHGSHGTGDLFLDKFMALVISRRGGELEPSFSHVSIVREKSGDVSIPDIVITTENFLCVIENKIMSREGMDQTTRLYRDAIKELEKLCFAEEQLFLVYLSPSEDNSPKDSHFIHVIYPDVINLLNEILLEELNPEVRMLIENFVFNLNDKVLKEFELEKEVKSFWESFNKSDKPDSFLVEGYERICQLYEDVKSKEVT